MHIFKLVCMFRKYHHHYSINFYVPFIVLCCCFFYFWDICCITFEFLHSNETQTVINNNTCYLYNFTVSHTQQSGKEGKSRTIVPFYEIRNRLLILRNFQVIQLASGFWKQILPLIRPFIPEHFVFFLGILDCGWGVTAKVK